MLMEASFGLGIGRLASCDVFTETYPFKYRSHTMECVSINNLLTELNMQRPVSNQKTAGMDKNK
jgi:hypothetical protein